jgi:zona occludens toxin (predicted ATPase)
MDLTPGRQRLVFVVIVIALVGLTSYLIESRHSSGTPAAAPSPSAGTSSAAATQASDVPPSTVPAATPASTAGGAEIYQWLPFTAADLSAAAQTTTSFAKD